MAMDDDGCNCKQAARPTSPPPRRMMKKKKSSGLRVLLPHVVLAAAHLARAARERGPRDVAFVAAAHGALALLFLCLGRHDEAAAPTGEERGWLSRVWVWALSAAPPPPLALLVYGMAVLVASGGFVLLFLCDAGDGEDGDAGLGIRRRT